jgi:hypothetical protein
MTADDVESYGVNPELLDAHSDALAGVLQLLIDSGRWDPHQRARRARLVDDAARWLAARLEPAPVAGVVVSDGVGGTRLELRTADQAAIPFDREALRQSNYEAWSDRYEPSEPSPELRAAIESLVTHDVSSLVPGSTLRIVSGDGLRALAALDPG